MGGGGGEGSRLEGVGWWEGCGWGCFGEVGAEGGAEEGGEEEG